MPVGQSWLRSKILKNLGWPEAYLLLQIVWNQPVRPVQLFGIERGYRRRYLKSLVEKDYIVKTREGYRVHPEYAPLNDEDRTFLWLWPLRFGHISIGSRVLLCIIDEMTGGRRHVNRLSLAESLGISRSTLYRHLEELVEKGLLVQWGPRGQRRLECFRRLDRFKKDRLREIYESKDYIRDEALGEPDADQDEERWTRDTEEVNAGHRGGEAGTRGFSPASLGSPLRKRRGGEGGEQDAGERWRTLTRKNLHKIITRTLQDNGAHTVPASLISKDLANLLAPLPVPPEQHYPRFLAAVQERLDRCKLRMWTTESGVGMRQDLQIALDAAVKEVQDAVQREQQRDADNRVLSASLVSILKEKGLYSVEALLQKDQYGETRLQEVMRKNMQVTSAVLALDPVTAEAWTRVSQQHV